MKYIVTVTAIVTSKITVEADNEDDAFDEATNLFFDMKIGDCEVDNREQDVQEAP